MNIKEYIKKNKINYAKFGKDIGISRDLCRKLALDKIKTIKLNVALKIVEKTNGEIQLNDLINKEDL